MPGRPWTSGERAQAVAWRETGVRRDDIAQRLGRTPEAVKRVLRAAGTGYADGQPGRPWTDEERALVVNGRRQGHSRATIAEQLRHRSAYAVKHLIRQLEITHRCAQCGTTKAAQEFAWSRAIGVPLCRVCNPRVRRSRRSLSEPIDITTDREGRILQLAGQFQQTSHSAGRRRAPFASGSYPMPTPEQWVQRFTEQPEIQGRILHDVLAEHWWIDHPHDRAGRRPHIRFTVDDLRHYLPTVAAHLVPKIP